MIGLYCDHLKLLSIIRRQQQQNNRFYDCPTEKKATIESLSFGRRCHIAFIVEVLGTASHTYTLHIHANSHWWLRPSFFSSSVWQRPNAAHVAKMSLKTFSEKFRPFFDVVICIFRHFLVAPVRSFAVCFIVSIIFSLCDNHLILKTHYRDKTEKWTFSNTLASSIHQMSIVRAHQSTHFDGKVVSFNEIRKWKTKAFSRLKLTSH